MNNNAFLVLKKNAYNNIIVLSKIKDKHSLRDKVLKISAVFAIQLVLDKNQV